MLVLFAAAVTVPLHVLLTFGVVETERPEGRGSLKAKPLRLVVVLGLVMVKVRLTLVPSGMLALANALAIVGGATTVRVAVLLVVPGPPSFELRTPVVLFFTPAVVPVTFTEMAHDAPAATVPLPRLTEVALAAAVNVPPQVLLAFGALATCTPLGSASLKETPVKASDAFGLLMVKLRVDIPPTAMLPGEKLLLMVAALPTVSVAVLLVVPVPPSVELTAPVVLLLTPPVVAVTSTEIVQEPLAAIVPPVRATVPLPAVAENVPPPQLPTAFGVLAT
jgi:hypothetical protein